jgi:hypothetical protein
MPMVQRNRYCDRRALTVTFESGVTPEASSYPGDVPACYNDMNVECRTRQPVVGKRTGQALDTELQRYIVRALAAKYPVFAVSTIERWVADTVESFGSARITKYLPILVQRSVDATLRELARVDGTSTDLLSVSKLTKARRIMALPDLGFWPAPTSPRRGFS